MEFVGVGDTGQPPHKATNTPRTNCMEAQIFGNQRAGKTRSHRSPATLTSLAEIKITAQLTITTTNHMRLLSSTGGGAALLRWPCVAVYLRSNRQLPMGAAPAAAGVQNHASKMYRLQGMRVTEASFVTDARTESLIPLSCVHLHLRDERDIFMLK